MNQKTSRHLWEYEHPYHCSRSNYYSNDCEFTYASWSDFLEEMGEADMDLNLVVRWDWRDADNKDNWLNQDELVLFYLHQRKGRFVSMTAQVQKSDEPSVRKWLLKNAAHMRLLWEPLIPPIEESPTPEPPKVYEQDESKRRKGRCESCGSPDVSVYPYRTGGVPGQDRNRYLCDVCASTQIGIWSEYDHYQGPQRDLGKAVAFATNRVLATIEKLDGADARQKAMAEFVAEMRHLSDRARKELH